MLKISPRFIETYPQAHIGVLVLKGTGQPVSLDAFAEERQTLEERLRQRYTGYDREQLKAHPALAAYDAYYSQFRKTYHVLLQLETVIFKGEPISAPSPLVEAMFMAELEHLLLTAGHDLAYVEGQITTDVASGEEQYKRLGGQQQSVKAGDMLIRDERGILSTVIYGPDQRTRIRSGTERGLFTVYAPRGIDPEKVREHLRDIERYVALQAKDLTREVLQVYPTG